MATLKWLLNLLQVLLGKRKRRQPADTDTWLVGSMVCADTEKYRRHGFAQQVGEIIDIKEESVVVHWYVGRRTTARSPWFLNAGSAPTRKAEGPHMIPWAEVVNKGDIWLHGFHLTNSGHLPEFVKDEILTRKDSVA